VGALVIGGSPELLACSAVQHSVTHGRRGEHRVGLHMDGATPRLPKDLEVHVLKW